MVLDFVDVKHADLSGLFAMKEVMVAAKKAQIFVFVSNVLPEVGALLARVEVAGADLDACPEELRDAVVAAQALSGNNVMADSLNEESLGLVSSLLRSSQARSMLEVARWTAEHGSSRDAKEGEQEGIELSRIGGDMERQRMQGTDSGSTRAAAEEEMKEDSAFPVGASQLAAPYQQQLVVSPQDTTTDSQQQEKDNMV